MSDKDSPAIEITDVCMDFGPMRALNQVSLTVATGSVHAFVGENGAGKSTTLGIVAGRIAPTSGRVEVEGNELRYGDPRACRKAGVVAIYQELTIVPTLTAEANVFLGQDLSRRGMLADRDMRARYVEMCERFGIAPAPARTPASKLSVAEQQILEILRAVVSEARIILFDEPTAALAEPEREALFRLMQTLREEGATLVLVTHNLDEVLNLSDTITVFRDGEVTTTRPRSEFTKRLLVNAMLGDTADDRVLHEIVDELVEDIEQSSAAATSDDQGKQRGTPLLAAREVTVPDAVTDLEIEVHPGEIVGIGGLVGSGRTTLLRALAGVEERSSGRLWLDGDEVAWPRTVRRALKHGIAMIPEDRKSQGLVMSMSAMENIALSNLRGATRRGMLTDKSIRAVTENEATSFGFSSKRLDAAAGQLSGGNQQKLLLARWSYVRPRVLLADEPTRGIDVGAKAEILKSLEAMAAAGVGIVIVSSELEEVAAISDRVIVLSEGRMSGVLHRTDDQPVRTSDILHLAFNSAEPVAAHAGTAPTPSSSNQG
ncbi:sugar ABC transporter ATP-binding protein [Gordonia sp. LSe1-13]|uniref:Sugar ABC transporter ATP-binding protein n=1 Tax=Gordonia sesuvii TaxID=3116777 RepID=A0ABU7MK67_9ACTN|nr:sugar ABC transporter ATP-binding protein [Gordonia sp. LSe1-13]